MKGYNTENGYMGFVDGEYQFFASEADYRDWVEEQEEREMLFGLVLVAYVGLRIIAKLTKRYMQCGKGEAEMGYGMEDGLTELELSGLNPEELGYMTGVERRRILEAAGLNPDEYDF